MGGGWEAVLLAERSYLIVTASYACRSPHMEPKQPADRDLVARAVADLQHEDVRHRTSAAKC